GLKSFEQVAKATMMLFKNELPFIEKIEATYITDPEEVEKQRADAIKIYEARDARTKGLHDEDVDVFYGCTLCQSFAPTNVCVVTPDRISLCGAINWFDGRAAAKVDPEGPQFAIPKGEIIDKVGGEYSGVNEKAVALSGGEYSRIKLHSFFEYPHTSCGCFEVVGFYIPEVDGIGWVDRDFSGTAPNGLAFSTMAGQTGGGKQIIGFLGVGVNYFRSPKFIEADGGWNRVIWMPKNLREKIKADIPSELMDKIPTEEEVTDLKTLRDYLEKKQHPITQRWAKEEAAVEAAPQESASAAPAWSSMPAPAVTMPAGMPMMPQFGGGEGMKLVFKNAKITIERIVLKGKEKQS
ncbi:MAG: CO dehydrogenase/CO-methylating acetyl-CoA synthase complex subunit beta, partial [Candidatus Methanoperedens sp.]|nr:CO dehydrogenase/CO-methylating acetyl-CoA synthase complex subunit beta [Candidatus Methanoperedens sp.]